MNVSGFALSVVGVTVALIICVDFGSWSQRRQVGEQCETDLSNACRDYGLLKLPLL